MVDHVYSRRPWRSPVCRQAPTKPARQHRLAVPVLGLSGLLVVSASVASFSQERPDVAPEADEPARPGLPLYAPEVARDDEEGAEAPTELRRYRLEDPDQPFLDTVPAAEAPPLRNLGLLPATLAPAIFPPRYHRVGDFALSGTATVGVTYDDNIEADDDDREDATVLGALVTGEAQSLFARHSLAFLASASSSYYVDEDENSDVAWVVGSDGRIDLSRRDAITASARYTQGTEDPESLDRDDDADEPAEFWYGSGRIGYERQFERLTWGIGGGVSHRDFDNVEPDDRDQTTYSASTDVSYQRSERLSLTGGLDYRVIRFVDEPEAAPSRDSERATAQVGAGYDLGQRLSVGASVGYSYVFFEDSGRDDEGSIVGDATLSYALPGRRTRVSFNLDHTVGTTTAEDASFRQTTSGTVGVTRVLGRKTALSGNLGYAHTDYDGDRPASDGVRAQVVLSHAINETFGVGTGYRFSQRFSDEEDSEFYRNLVFVGLTANF